MTISTAAKAAVFAPETDEVFAVLVTITTDALSDPIRLSTDNKDVLPVAGVRGTLSRGEEYLFCPFNLTLDNQDDTNIAKARLEVDNVDRRIMEGVRLSAEGSHDISITVEIVLASQPDTVEISLPNFRLERVRYNAFTVSGEITVEYFDLEPFPSGRFTPSGFPGLY